MSREIYRRTVAPHLDRVRYDGAAEISRVDALIQLARYYEEQKDSIKLLYCPALTGNKLRVSAVNNFVSKGYDISKNANDLTQSTALNQPDLCGNIVPTEIQGIKNVNGASKYLTHPAISFGANDAWSVTTVLNWNGTHEVGYWNASYLCDLTYTTRVSLYSGASSSHKGQLAIRGLNANEAIFNVNTEKYIGKNIVVTLVYNNFNIYPYINGVSLGSQSLNSGFTFYQINYNLANFWGKIYAHIIRSQSLTAAQVLSEYTILRSIFSEVESVVIGTQTLTSSNCEMACTLRGNVIPEIQLSTNTEKITNGDMTNWGGAFPNEMPAGWFNFGTHTSNNYVTQSSGKCRIVSTDGTAAGVSQVCLTAGKLYKLTFDLVSHLNGALEIAGLVNSAFNTSQIAIGTRTFYSIATATSLTFKRGTVTDFTIDNVSVQEVGWADSQNVYDWYYTNATGTVEQKTYAAVKMAAMWCHSNNDVTLGAVYGKLYNWFAVKLIQMDIDYYNVANPSTPWGWRLPTQTDYQTLSTYLGGDAVSGGKMKIIGLNYWNTPNTDANNLSGFSAIGSGYRDANTGNFLSNKNGAWFWTQTNVSSSNSKWVLLYFNSANMNTDINLNKYGASLRLIKV